MNEPLEKVEGFAEVEELLKQTLKRVLPPPGTEQKIMAAVHQAAQKRKFKKHLAIAAGLLSLFSLSSYLTYRHHQMEKAKQQLIFALQLTSQTLDLALEAAFYEARQIMKSNFEEEPQ